MQARPLEPARSVALVGTYPPTRCGIATFNASLARAIRDVRPDCRLGVVACADAPSREPGSSDVVSHLLPGSAPSREAAVRALEAFDAVVVQHEFGIYGGPDGAEVVDLVREIVPPTIVVLHTVTRRPTASQQAIVEELAALCDRVVVQSEAARVRLLEQYGVDGDKVRTIPHGARHRLPAVTREAEAGRRPVVLTWGLLGEGKGIEFGIEAIARLADLDPPPVYVVIGQTHPRVLETRGEEYRESLVSLAAELGAAHLVEFDNAYHDTRTLLERVQDADVVLLPYRSREQVVSGVLVEAIAAGKPVVATRFPHAEELLGEGSGLLVPHEDPEAIAGALRRLLTDGEIAARARAVARRQAWELRWEAVAARYLELVAEIAGHPAPARPGRELPAPRFDHLLRLTDETGVFEHAKLTRPRRSHGYCTDDVSRALVAVTRERDRGGDLDRLADVCLTFLERAQLPDGRFHNRLSPRGRWLDAVGPDDATGRAIWAAGTTAVAAPTRTERERALALFRAAASFRSPWPRANAFAILGAADVATAGPEPAARAARRLLRRAVATLGTAAADAEWPWPEPRLTYANAVLAEARIAAGVALGRDDLVEEGLRLLAWLVVTETAGDHFSFTPVGGRGRGELPPAFDQQPVEAGAMADACARAFDVTGDARWADAAVRAAAWFLGENDVGVPLVDAWSGGCRDGLEAGGVNENQGAESTIAMITALQQARRVQAAARRAARSSAVSTLAAPIQRSAAPYVR